MTSSYTETITFTETHARHLAAKIATDLKRMQRFYGSPDNYGIPAFEAEAIEFMKAGYLGSVTYGFKRSGNWIEPTLRYTARDLVGLSGSDDDPGAISPRANIKGATFYSFLTYSDKWWGLAADARAEFKSSLPVQRTAGVEPGVNGNLVGDRTYSSGGRALDRSIVRGF